MKAPMTSKALASAGKVVPIKRLETPRRQRRAAEILAAARAIFLDKGFDRASVSEIAAKVGVAESLACSYFDSKRELLNQVLCAMYDPLILEIENSFSRLLNHHPQFCLLLTADFF